jgi:hypothetical protein
MEACQGDGLKMEYVKLILREFTAHESCYATLLAKKEYFDPSRVVQECEWSRVIETDSTISIMQRVQMAYVEAAWVIDLKGLYPEIESIRRKLMGGEGLTKTDEWNLNEIVEATGWEKDDVVKDLKELEVDPKEREIFYYDLFEKYYREACELKEKDFEKYSTQAAEKLWGAITAFIKAYAARKGVLVVHWSKGKLEKFVENNVEANKQSLFHDLLNNGNLLHEHFYEKYLSKSNFNSIWQKCCELIDKVSAHM